MPLLRPPPLRPGPAESAPASRTLSHSRRRRGPQWSLLTLCPTAPLQACPWAPPPHGALPPAPFPVVPQPSFSYSGPLGPPYPPSPAGSPGPPGLLLVPRRGATPPRLGYPMAPTGASGPAAHGERPGPQSWLSSTPPPYLSTGENLRTPHSPSPQAPSSPPTPGPGSTPYGFPTSGSHLAWLLGTVLASALPTPTCTTAFSPPLAEIRG